LKYFSSSFYAIYTLISIVYFIDFLLFYSSFTFPIILLCNVSFMYSLTESFYYAFILCFILLSIGVIALNSFLVISFLVVFLYSLLFYVLILNSIISFILFLVIFVSYSVIIFCIGYLSVMESIICLVYIYMFLCVIL